MNWKEQLRVLEHAKQWDVAIEFMKNVIKENPNDMDAYIFMNYLLMHLLVEENFDRSQFDNYKALIKWYFDESYAKFSNNPEYLYITARIAVMSEWYFGISVNDYEYMIKKASELELDNLLYQEDYYYDLSDKDPKNPELIAYARTILSENSPIREQLKTKGAVGEYLLTLKKRLAERILWNAFEKKH